MRATEEQHNARKREMMEKCFECYAENGLTGTGIKALAAACGCTTGNLYSYFNSVDELIIESTAYCMEKVEDDFMEMAPTDPKDVVRFVKEVPYWTAQKHGKKYRLMYQIYTHPKYIEHGKKFFEGVNERYTEYAKRLEPKIGIPYTVITPLIFIFVRACVHYAMFEDEYYLQTQMEVLKQGVALFGGLAGLFGQGKDALHFAGPLFIRRDIGTGHGHHAGEHDQLTAQHGLAGSMVDTAAHGTGVLHVVLLCYAVALARVIQRRALAPTSMRTLVSKPSVSKLSRLSM